MLYTFMKYPEKNDRSEWVRVDVDSRTRRITFSYMSSDNWYEFHLLNECNDEATMLLLGLLTENEINFMSVKDGKDYYTIVTQSKLVFEK